MDNTTLSTTSNSKQEKETWKVIKGFSNYEVSTLGKLRNKGTKVQLKLNEKGGYYHVSITNNEKKSKSMKIHRLIALTFIPNAENKETVNHIDHNKLNNK